MIQINMCLYLVLCKTCWFPDKTMGLKFDQNHWKLYGNITKDILDNTKIISELEYIKYKSYCFLRL